MIRHDTRPPGSRPGDLPGSGHVGGATLVTFTYDDNGNQTVENRGGVQTGYNYDRENRLQVLVEPDQSRTTMVYDATGLRRVKQTASATTTYVWDGSDYLGEVQ